MKWEVGAWTGAEGRPRGTQGEDAIRTSRGPWDSPPQLDPGFCRHAWEAVTSRCSGGSVWGPRGAAPCLRVCFVENKTREEADQKGKKPVGPASRPEPASGRGAE